MADTPSLTALVIEFLATHSGQALAPWQIAEGITARLDGRHVGVAAVTNTCLHLAAHGRLVQATPDPKTFALVARAQDQSGRQ